MAVARVFGTVDGAEVVLEQTERDRWSVPVPMDQGGEYVVEIIAEDEAGNRSYMAKMLFAINTALLCTHIVPMPYIAVLQGVKPVAEVLGSMYYAELVEPVCGLAGRRA